MTTSFSGKTVLITGASSGIGREVARAFAQKGARLILAARNKQNLERVQQELSGPNYVVDIVPLDVSSRTAVQKAFARLEKKGKHIDILVNNAAVGLFETIANTEEKDLQQMMGTNFYGPWHCIQAVLPQMRHRGGSIVNLSSAIAKHAPFYQGFYAGSKAALDRLSESLRIEEKRHGIEVFSISIDRTRTDFRSHLLGNKENYLLPFKTSRWASSPDVAQKILLALEQKKYRYHTSWKSWLFDKVAGLAPEVVHALFQREYGKVRS